MLYEDFKSTYSFSGNKYQIDLLRKIDLMSKFYVWKKSMIQFLRREERILNSECSESWSKALFQLNIPN